MASVKNVMIEITPQVLLKAYTCGIFPMAESAEDPALYWIEPQHRGIIPLEDVHIPKRLARTVRQDKFEVKIDTSFEGVIDACALARPGRQSTWINARIRTLYRDLYEMGHCHTVETWLDGKLVGGLYGVHLNGAFFGESMFSTESEASKVALVHLISRLMHGGFTLLDTQFLTDHLAQFGTVEVERGQFQDVLEEAMKEEGDFFKLGKGGDRSAISGARAIEIIRAYSSND